jgi:hypothetical protein
MSGNASEHTAPSFNVAAARLSALESLEWPTLEATDALSAAVTPLWDAPLNTRRFAAPLPLRAPTPRGFVGSGVRLSRAG